MTEQNLSLIEEVKRRRTFALISHPDAGKTTLTEKFLLYGGAIREAGSVKSRRSQKHAVSDWMEIEKQRGISVASSVLQFEYNNFCINILDTAIQVFKQPNGGMEELIVGVVGVLQFEVLEYRLKQEYGVDVMMYPLPYSHVRWVENDLSKFGKLSMPMDTLLVEDKNRNSVVLFANEWSVRTLVERNEGLVVRETSL